MVLLKILTTVSETGLLTHIDPEYSNGVLMNCSDKKEYDALFPQHPLSEMRRFIAELIELN